MSIYKTWTKEQFTLFMRIAEDHGDGITGITEMDAKMDATDPAEWREMLSDYASQEIGSGVVVISDKRLFDLATQAGSIARIENLYRKAGVKFISWIDLCTDPAYDELSSLDATLSNELGFIALNVCAVALASRIIRSIG